MLRRQLCRCRRGGRGKSATATKDNDWVDQLFIANTHDYILCFSDKGRVYWLKVWEVPQGSRGSRGRPIINMFPLQEDETGLYFELPIDALDSTYTCAALSVRKQAWYPRILVFRSDSLSLEAFSAERLITAASLGLSDGQYECEAALEGKGRTTVFSPSLITVKSGECTAHIVFSTAKIDYIIVNEEKYVPVTAEGGAAFDIPVVVFDQKISLVVDSTAIKPATEVSYSITFFSETLSPADEGDR